MTAALLIENFDHLLTTPAAVEQLNAAILQLAAQGKLVPQDPSDEPASELLKRIRAEKAKQDAKGLDLPPVSDDEKPFELPSTLVWTRLGEVSNYGDVSKSNGVAFTDETWVLDLEDIEKTTSRLIQKVRRKDRAFQSEKNAFQKGDVIYGKLRPYLDKVIVADEAGVCSSELIPIEAYGQISPYYLRLVLKRPDFIEYVNQKTYGVKMPRLGTKDARMALFPLPPLAEQHRIVACVEQLLAQTRQLAERLARAQHSLDHLTEAALGQLLNATEHPEHAEPIKRPELVEGRGILRQAQDASPIDFNARWDFIAQHFDSLFTTPEHIAPLRQTVLELAVRGKLTRREATDDSVSELLKRIYKDKQEEFPSISEDEKPFELPSGWEFVRLGELAKFVDYRGHTPPKTQNGMRLITAKNVRMGRLNLEPREYVDPAIYDKWMTRGIPRKGDLLFTTEAPMGNVCMLDTDEKALFAQRLITLKLYGNANSKFAMFALMSEPLQRQILGKSSGVTARGIKAKLLKTVLMPLPSLAEQQRIVARVEALLQQCDALEAKLRAQQAARENAWGALIAHLGAEVVTKIAQEWTTQ